MISAARRAMSRRGDAASVARLVPAGETTAPVPEFVREVARESGVELAGLVWTIDPESCTGAPRALYEVHHPLGDGGSAGEPGSVDVIRAADPGDRYVVKIGWHPQVNAGIENENLALRALTTRVPVASGSFPKPAFFAVRGAVVLSGQHAVPGRPFAECTDGSPTCARAERALAWLVDMGAGTFRPRETAVLTKPLEEIVERYAMTFGPSAEVSRFLHTQAEMLFSAGSLPTVLHHGDPDPRRNVRITDDGATAFLGWEECAPEGLPLWDLYWFAEGYGRLTAERERRQWGADAFEKQFLERTLYSVTLVRAVAASCERLALSPRLAEPLFHLGWATRAVRGGPDAGTFAGILERSVAASRRDGRLALFHG